MKRTLLFLALLNGWMLPAQSVHWISNNPSDEALVQFTEVQDAVDVAQAGDTLLAYPSGITYENINVDKPLYISSIGYFADTTNQPSLEIETFNFNATLGTVTISVAGSGSKMESIYITGLEVDGVTDLALNKCHITAGKILNSSNVQVIGNYIGSGGYALELCAAPNFYRKYNLGFQNCSSIIISSNLFGTSSYGQCHQNKWNLLVDDDCGNILLKNNVMRYKSKIKNSMVVNNVFLDWTSSISNIPVNTNNTYDKNVFTNGSPLGVPSSNNFLGADPSTIFVGYPTKGSYSFDSRYQLLPTSPAKGYGTNGEDCGIFGGEFPYKLSGINNRPLIYSMEVPTTVSGNNVNINIKVRSEN